MTRHFADKAPHRISVIPLVSFEDHTVARTLHYTQMALLEPGIQRVHIAACCGFADAQHLAVVEEFPGRPVPKQFKQKAAPSPLAVCRVGIGLISQALPEFFYILRAALYVNAFPFMILKSKMVFSNAEFKIFELSLYSSFTDAEFFGDLLLGNRLPSFQQDPEDLLNPWRKLHNLPPLIHT